MKNIFLLLGTLLVSVCSFAQFEIDPGKMIDKMIGPLESDRPGQCMNAKSAGLLAIQLQSGFNYQRSNIDKISKYEHFYVPVNLRFGLTNKWEINSNFYYLKQQFMDTSLFDWKQSGFLSPEIGVRFAFLNGNRWKPFMALQSNLSFISHHGTYHQNQWGSSFYIITSNRFERVSFNTNFGLVFPGNASFSPAFPWVAHVVFPVGKKFSLFGEGFGEFRSSTISWDAGLAFIPINDLQLDLFGGMINITQERTRWFIEMGVSYRFSIFKTIAKKKAGELLKGLDTN